MYGFGLLSLGAFGLGMDFMKVARREQFKIDQANENLAKFQPFNLIGQDAVNYPW
jgi:hydrogenase maturation factor HypF (carbamoyltransferase family)